MYIGPKVLYSISIVGVIWEPVVEASAVLCDQFRVGLGDRLPEERLRFDHMIIVVEFEVEVSVDRSVLLKLGGRWIVLPAFDALPQDGGDVVVVGIEIMISYRHRW